MINILFVYGDILRRGGMEAYMMNTFRNVDRKKVHIDFAVQRKDKTEVGVYDREIKEAGSEVFYLPKVGRHPGEYYKKLTALLSCGKYQIVHAHSDAMNYRILKLADKCGVPVRISHSHNTSHILGSRLKEMYYELCRSRVYKYATDCWACSAAAGVWLYQNHDFEIIPNAIDTERFAFNPQVRAALRDKFGLTDSDIVLGHIGRFDYQKNHEFMVKLIESLEDEKYKLLLVGEGFFLEETREYVIDNNLRNKVIFVGSVDDPQDYYQMMDFFVLPSRFEGFPVVLVEAQCNGLRCLVSDRVTRESNVSGLLKFIHLDIESWEKALKETDYSRDVEACKLVASEGYDNKEAGQKVTRMYIDACKRSGWIDDDK